MFATRFVLLGLILFLTRAASDVTRCCPPGKVILKNSKSLECVSVSNAIELYIYQWNNITEIQEIPQCDASEVLKVTQLDKLSSIKMPACFGQFYDQNTGTYTATAIYCESNEDQQVKVINAPQSQLLFVSKCCPSDKVFDSHTKTCVDRLSESENLVPFLINRSNKTAEHVVMVTTQGPPICQQPIVDYEIDENDIFLLNISRVMTTSFIRINNNNNAIAAVISIACLEVTPDFASNRKLIARVCVNPNFCDTNACIRKCCPENEFFLAQKTAGAPLKCDKPTTSYEPTKFHKTLAIAVNQTKSTFNTTKDYGVFVQTLPCNGIQIYPVNPRKKNQKHGQWSLTSEGHVLLEDNSRPKKYCMDFYKKPELDTFYLFMCSEETIKDSITLKVSIRLLPVWIISCICLLMTLLVYTCLPNLRNLYGKIVTCYIISHFLRFVLMYISTWFSYRNLTEEQSRTTCKALASMQYFFEISTLFWLNVMCFDTWRKFGAKREDTIMECKYWKRFLLYCLYVCGFSLLLSIVSIVTNSTEFMPDYLKVDLKNEWLCFVPYKRDSLSELIWYFGPLTILLIPNVVFVILTSMSSNKEKAELKTINADPTNSRWKQFYSNRERFVMNVKLFILTGVFTFWALAEFFLRKYFDDEPPIQTFSNVDLLYRSFEGLLIFILFVLTKRVYQEFRQRLELLRKNPPQLELRAATPHRN